MSVNWETVGLSVGSSCLVSLFTFVLGLRAGKNQSDRQTLKQHYRDLHNYFTDLKSHVEAHRPRTWKSYQLEIVSSTISYTGTPLAHKIHKGLTVEIKQKF